uniref:RNA-directed DNA polymerase, eukaryota n=1 Tax=Tanacetum cinerariifolium TaxID=118510 RepID=A0A6L2JDN3_TANCI|nr:RNA-directed DNA polymerase, eukaryota [Tanacetum cinerariifolium]
MRLFVQARAAKEDLRKQYVKCKDISSQRHALIDKFLENEGWKDYENLESKIDSNIATLEDQETHIKLLHDTDKIDSFEALDLQQKSRIKLDIEGDKNFKFLMVSSIKDVELILFMASCLMARGLLSHFIRQILDGPLMLSEMIDWFKKQKKMLIFKVDFEKAFDSVSWKYLDHMLHVIGFGLTWRSWIRSCLESSWTSILVNGSPTSEFSVKCGLWQGDPLSPFLFIIFIEGLHMALMEASHFGLIRGIKIGSSDITLSHIFYTYDVVITTEWSSLDMDNSIRVL